jgi:PHS family inorganic phosphate transporter-like MFS transporter
MHADITDGTFVDETIAETLIHTVLEHNMTHAIYTVSIASIVGSIAMIVLVNRLDRRMMLICTFWLLAVVLLVASLSFRALFHNGGLHIVLIVYWVVISFLFSFGPNTLTFIVSRMSHNERWHAK